jgi:hypothetical protein
MIDIDKELVDMVKEHMPEWHQGAFDDPRTTLLHEDARGWMENNQGAEFDVILSDLPNPHEDGPALQPEVYLVLLEIAGPLLRDVRIGEDRLDGTLRLTGTTIDALVRLNIELVVALVDAVHRAHLDAASVFRVEARLGNDVSHKRWRPGCSRR